MRMTLGEIAGIVEAPAPAAGEVVAVGGSIDSRTLREGELFFALRGENADGHQFVPRALEAGAAGAVIAADRLGSFPEALRGRLLPVADPVAALQRLAAEVRARWGGPLVAITGSTGKTTTKQILTALLATRYRVLSNVGNLNNHLGLPLSLLRLDDDTEAGVFELGMSARGEIALLARIARPDVGIVTNVGAAHLQFFKSVDEIALAKRELVEALPDQGWAVLNADDDRVAAFSKHTAARALFFGMRCAAHFRAEEVAPSADGGYSFVVRGAGWHDLPAGALRPRGATPLAGAAPSGDERFHSPLLGRHNVLNTVAALAAAYLFGLAPSELTEAVRALRPAEWRGEVVRLASGALAVNDCYNSNPEALQAMLVAVSEIPARRRLALLGGMMELGPDSEELHRMCGRKAAELGYDWLLTVGGPAQAIAAGAAEAGMPTRAMRHFSDPESAGEQARRMLRPGDVVLVKASRSVHLERAWRIILDSGAAATIPAQSGAE